MCVLGDPGSGVGGRVWFTLAEAYKEPGNTTKVEELREYCQNIGEMKTASGALRFQTSHFSNAYSNCHIPMQTLSGYSEYSLKKEAN